MIILTKRVLARVLSCALVATILSACVDSVVAPRADAPPLTQETRKRECLVAADGYQYKEECYYQEPIGIADRAIFYDVAEVAAAVDQRYGTNMDGLIWYEQQQDYQSLRAYLDSNEWTEETAAAGGDSEAATGSEGIALENDGVIRDDFDFGDGFLSLLNTRGEVQVGDTVYKVTRDNAYAVHVNDLAVLREKVPTLSSPAPEYDPRIVSQAVDAASSDEETPAYSRESADGGTALSLGWTTGTCTWQVGNRRMKGKVYITNALVYSEAGIRTDWERRKWFGWSNTWQAGSLEWAYTSVNLRVGQNGWVQPSGSGFLPNGGSSIHHRIKGAWFQQIRGTIDGTHTSSVGQCYTRVSR